MIKCNVEAVSIFNSSTDNEIAVYEMLQQKEIVQFRCSKLVMGETNGVKEKSHLSFNKNLVRLKIIIILVFQC